MNDFKSKLPDFKEITSIATKLFKDLKTSLDEIVKDYKVKRSAKSQEAPSHRQQSEHKTHKHEEKPKAEHSEQSKPETKKNKKSAHSQDEGGH